MSRDTSFVIARRTLEALSWRTSLSRAKQKELVALIADTLDENIADVLAEFAGLQARIAESIAELSDGGSGQSNASADAYARSGRQLRAGADRWRASITLRRLAADHPELCFAPEKPNAHDTELRVWLDTDTLPATLAALHAWTSHIADAELRLDRPDPPLVEPTLRLTGHLGEAQICVVGELDTSQPLVAEHFLPRFPAADDTVLPLDVLAEAAMGQPQP